jgi:hypothetical protein
MGADTLAPEKSGNKKINVPPTQDLSFLSGVRGKTPPDTYGSLPEDHAGIDETLRRYPEQVSLKEHPLITGVKGRNHPVVK